MKRITAKGADVAFYDAYWKRRRWAALKVSKILKLRQFKFLIRRNVPRGAKIMDIGCGRGELADIVGSTHEVTAFDFSADTIASNKQRHPEINFLCRDALDTPPEEEVEAYDAVTCMDVVEHIPFEQQPRLLYNITQYLRIGGLLVISTPDRREALRYKTDKGQDDEVFLKQYEGQPVADCLNEEDLDELLANDFRVCYRGSVAPTVTNRVLDISWKTIAVLFGYQGVNSITRRFGIPCRYLIRAAIRVN